MGVNYTPDYESINGNMKTLKPFRFWCQKVLPLVYDDSLSYYELLNKVVQYLNDTMENVDGLNDNVNTLDENVRAIYQAYNQLQDYVNNYFDNLDVQEEINNKLDDMATDGTLSGIISSIATPLIPDIVSDWMEENLEPTTPVVDATLSISGAAADAKVTGDNISNLKSDLNYTQEGNALTFLMPHNLMIFDKIDGYYINYETGIKGVNASYSYMVIPCFGENTYQPSGFSVNTHIAFFDIDMNYLSGVLWRNGTIHTPQNCKYMSVSMVTSDFSSAVLYDTSVLDENNTTSILKQIRNLRPDYEFFSDYVGHGKNYFDKFHITEGGFIDFYYKGSITTNADYCYCPTFIPAKPLTTYVPNNPCLVSEFNKNKNWIVCHNLTTAGTVAPFTTDEDCAFIRVSAKISDINTFMLEEGTVVTSYEPFRMSFNGEPTSQYIIVATDGSGDYLTITDAFNNSSSGDTIYIKDGLYQESLKLNGHLIHLIGESKEKTIIEYLNTNYANPPIEIAQGSIENLTVHASKASGQAGAYCLHCDNAASANGYLYCRNVKFINDNYQAIGIGLEPHFTLSFNNCEIYGQFYCHDCAREFSDLTGQVVRVIDSTIYTENEALGAIRMQSQERTGAEATAVFQRCIVKNPGGANLVYMGLWQSGEELAKDGWLGSTDWTLDVTSDLNNSSILNATT